MDVWKCNQVAFAHALTAPRMRAGCCAAAHLVARQPDLCGEGAVIRMFGRLGRFMRVITMPFPAPEAAWPPIRAIISVVS
jgi:hypothetical protein